MKRNDFFTILAGILAIALVGGAGPCWAGEHGGESPDSGAEASGQEASKPPLDPSSVHAPGPPETDPGSSDPDPGQVPPALEPDDTGTGAAAGPRPSLPPSQRLG